MGLIVRNVNFGGRLRGTFPQVPPPPPAPSNIYAQYTVLDLPGTGTNNTNNNVFIDSSSNNFSITRVGNTTQGSFSPFSTQPGYWSNYFDGSGDYLTLPSSTAFNVATGDFTIEFWINCTSITGSSTPIFKRFLNTTSNGPQISSTFKFGWWQDTLSEILVSTTTASIGVWYHIAYVRSGTTFKLYVNGINESTVTNSASYDFSSWDIGRGFYGNPVNGYISNFRIVKGTAVYTSNFTPSTTPLTAVSGTSLLTCQSNRFIDNSSNSFAITRNGNTSVSAFGPFNPASSYNTATMGGSMYFDGNGDYLTVPGSSAFAFGSGNFTVEAWVNFSSTNSGIFLIRSGNEGPERVLFYANSTGTLFFDIWGVNTWTLGGSFPTNTWNHVAWVRSGSTVSGYINGVLIGSASVGGSSAGRTEKLDISSIEFNGYSSNIRIVKGTAVYTSNFTPPTAPVAAITGTSLLLNGTNAAIFDASTKNNLETVGNAVVSTAVSASGSMYFDGNGDCLTIPGNTNLTFGSGDFTIECWVYLTTLQPDARVILSYGWPTINGPYLIYTDITVNNSIFFYSSSNGSSWDVADKKSIVSAPTANTWYHLAITRSGNTFRTFSNGNQTTTWTSSASLYSPPLNYPLSVGSGNGIYNTMNGYINDLRITNGIARYTANFTPPSRS